MEHLIGLCEICRIREGIQFDDRDRWVCEQCDYENNYHEFDYEESYDEEDDFTDSYRF